MDILKKSLPIYFMASNDSITNAMILGAILTHIADQKNPCLVTL